MRLLYILAFFCVTYIQANAQPATWSWASSLGGNSNFQYYMDIDVDDAGNTYLISEYTGTRTFGSFTLTASANNQAYAAKLDPAGNILWVKALGYPLKNSNAAGIVVADGGVYVSGLFYNYIEIDTILLSGTGQTDIFLAKLDTATGSCQWMVGAGGLYQDKPVDMDRAVGGGVVLTGHFRGTAIFGNDTVINPSNFNNYSFLARYLDDGSCSWVKSISSTNSVELFGVAQSRNGQIAVTGAFLSNATFSTSPSVTVSAGATSDVVTAKYDSSGNALWAKSGGGNGSDSGQGVGMDDNGGVYVIGNINGQCNFSGLSVVDNGAGNVLLIKYSATGTPVWAKSEGGNQFDSGIKISTDHGGSSYITGIFTNVASFGGNNLSGTNDAFFAKYDPNGVVRWAAKAGGSTSYDQGIAIVADSSGICYVAGTFYGTGTFGSNSLSAPTNEWSNFIGEISGGTVGLETVYANGSIAIYPNPTNDLLNIRSDADQSYITGISIYGVDGKLVGQNQFENGTVLFKSVDVSQLTKGVYHVRIDTEEGSVSGRFVKQ